MLEDLFPNQTLSPSPSFPHKTSPPTLKESKIRHPHEQTNFQNLVCPTNRLKDWRHYDHGEVLLQDLLFLDQG